MTKYCLPLSILFLLSSSLSNDATNHTTTTPPITQPSCTCDTSVSYHLSNQAQCSVHINYTAGNNTCSFILTDNDLAHCTYAHHYFKELSTQHQVEASLVQQSPHIFKIHSQIVHSLIHFSPSIHLSSIQSPFGISISQIQQLISLNKPMDFSQTFVLQQSISKISH